MEVDVKGKLYKAKPAGKLGYFGITLRVDDYVVVGGQCQTWKLASLPLASCLLVLRVVFPPRFRQLKFKGDVADSGQVPMIIRRAEKE